MCDIEIEKLDAETEALNKRAIDTLANARDHMERSADFLDQFGMKEEATRQRRAANECRGVIRFLSGHAEDGCHKGE